MGIRALFSQVRNVSVSLCLCGLSVISSVFTTSGIAAAQEAASKKVDIVSVTGCLREQGAGNWMLVAATDPVPSIANAASSKEVPTTAPDGKNSFKLIGVSEFGLPGKKDRTLVVRGLFIKAAPVSRINVTSIVEALPNCAARAPK
jgi:hypothetical protein